MSFFGRIIQRWRDRVVRPWIPVGARVLDIGCQRGEFLRSLGDSIGPSVGLDPLAPPETNARYSLVPEAFREPAPFPDAAFDVVVMLATLKQIPEKDPLVRECFRLLRPGGRVVLTLPSPWLAGLVALLARLCCPSRAAPEGRPGADPRSVPPLFARHGFALETWHRFQLGMNHLFVFRKPLPSTAETPQTEAVPALREKLAHA
jgi:SAM-dependent methyltransferase